MTFLAWLRGVVRGRVDRFLLIGPVALGDLQDDLNPAFVGQIGREALADRRRKGVIPVVRDIRL
jgi:hypothetical protein